MFVKKPTGETRTGKIIKMFTFKGLQKRRSDRGAGGRHRLVAGLPDIYIGETITTDENAEPLPAIAVDEPTITLNFLVNNSPFAGREGKYVTSRQIRERLERELEINVGLKVDFDSGESLQGLRPRRTAHRDTARKYAPRRLRDAGLPAAGHLPRRERHRSSNRSKKSSSTRRRNIGRHHRAPRHAQVRHERSQGPRESGAPRVRRPDARASRLSQPIRARHQRRGHHVLARRRLPAVRGRDQEARRSAR